MARNLNIPPNVSDIQSVDARGFFDYIRPKSDVFTPVLNGTSAAGEGTYTTQLGRYTLIGNLCFMQISLVWTAHTGTGNIAIGDLPFISAAEPLNYQMNVWHSNITGTSGETFTASVDQATTTMTLEAIDFNAAAAAIAMDTAGSLIITGFYETN